MIIRTVLFGLVTGMLLPAQVLAQSAPGSTPPAKAAVVVVQTSGAQTAPAPAVKPAALPTPSLSLALPAVVQLGETASLGVSLRDAEGAPISGAAVDFSTSVNFLNTDGSIMIGRAVTDSDGRALIEWEPRSNGTVTVDAAFAGDRRFAAARASATVAIQGAQQLYQQHAGVVLPGVNTAPLFTRTAALAPVVSPWPKLSGWPVVVVLLIVWSLYARAISALFTIARDTQPTLTRRAVR